MNNITFPDFPPDLTEQLVRTAEHPATGGPLANIWRCTYQHPFGSKLVAVKAFRMLPPEPTSSDQQTHAIEVRRQLEIWKRLDHPNILPFLGIATGFSPFVALVSEWMPNGTLYQFLRNNDAMSIARRLQLLVDIASGLEYLHSLPVIHGDLTSTNILIDAHQRAHLSGFCLSTVPEHIAAHMPYLRADFDLRDAVSIRFMPPELVVSETSNHIGTAVDIFSLGCNGLLVLSGQLPWSEYHRSGQIVLSLYHGRTPARPSTQPINDHHWTFLESCWAGAPDRPSASSTFLAFYSFLASL